MIKLGIDEFLKKNQGIGRFALLANYASVNSHFEYTWHLLLKKKKKDFVKIFSPQHGLWGTEQANMIETCDTVDKDLNLQIISLYGNDRKPSREALIDIDTVLIDLQDVGSKYYTYIYTMSLVMTAAAENKKKVIVLDRPNPLGGKKVYGNLTKLKSFVGLHPLPIEHGLTIGELALLFKNEFSINCDLEVIKMKNYDRTITSLDAKYPWVMLSPNMPHPQTAFVYPGGCLLEGTNVSEGRGTTRPFEFIGAPFISSKALLKELSHEALTGVKFREITFKPTFDKFKNEPCNGIFLHVTNYSKFNAYLTYIAIIKAIFKLKPASFKWLSPPYEYEYKELPIDILTGDKKIREMIERGETLKHIDQYCKDSLKPFLKTRKKFLLY